MWFDGLHVAILLFLEFMGILIAGAEVVVGDVGEGGVAGGDEAVGLVVAVEEVVELVCPSLPEHHVVNYNNMLVGKYYNYITKRDKNKNRFVWGMA